MDDAEQMQEDARRRAEQLVMAVLKRDHGAIFDNCRYEGFSSSKGYKVDKFLERYYMDHYVCSKIEVINVEVFPPDRAEVTVRAHLSVSPHHDMPPERIDVWELILKDKKWLLLLHR